tara:strand:- start:525 stop:2273 length:1749 start_codon:yes stop_codon:yes gene_type:complete
MTEKILFLRWIILNPIYTLLYYFKKTLLFIKKKLFKNHTYENKLYLKTIKNLAEIKYKRIQVKKIISLASTNLNVINNIEWEKNFKDPEDEERLHRFSWAIDCISKKKISDKELKWIENEIYYWYSSIYENDKNLYSKSLKWEPYTVSERISNIFLFYNFLDKEIPKSIKQRINNETIYLINNLEFFNNSINNHIINNSRAIYFASLICNNKNFKYISIKIFKSTINKLITSDGFLREGSSHYQVLFHRWIFEIFYFLKKNNDHKYASYIDKINKKLCNGTSFFIVKKNKTLFHLFGDISPDFTPTWISDFPEIYNLNIIKKKNYASWNNLFLRIMDKKKLINFKKTKLIKKNINKNSGWFKFTKFNHEIIFRLNKTQPPNFPGHYHHDAGHFVYSYKRDQIFVDTGRFNYHNSNDYFAKNHNTITINKLGLTPINKVLPFKYSQSFNTVKFKDDKEELRISLIMNGFSRINVGSVWTRNIILRKKKIIINDCIQGKLKNNLINSYFYTDLVCINRSGNINFHINKNKGVMKSNIYKKKINNYKASYKRYGKHEYINRICYTNFTNIKSEIQKNKFTLDWNI